MFKSITNSRFTNEIIFVVLFTIFSFVSLDLLSQDYGGYTDPKTPGRHSRLNIDSANVVVKPHGIYAEVTTEFWYRSVDLVANTDTLEMYAFFFLPATDFINDSWLWVEDTLVHAMIMDVNSASLIYENIVHRLHRDPSIFYRRSTSGSYEYRIFPNVGSQNRHAKISYFTKMNYTNGLAQFTFTPTILNLSINKSFPKKFKFYLDFNFTGVNFGSTPPKFTTSTDNIGKNIEFTTTSSTLQQTFSYEYDFTAPYFSKSKRIDDQEYYFTMFDSKILTSNYINQKINFLIDFDLNRTSINAKDMITQLKKVILSNLNELDSINIMIGNKSTVNLFNRWVPCNKDTINFLLDSNVFKKIGLYSNLYELMTDGVKFNKKFNSNSSVMLLTSSEYCPTPTSANPLIEECVSIMSPNNYKITTIDFSDIRYSVYTINKLNYKGNQYFNEKIAELTHSEFFTTKVNNLTIESMISTSFVNSKGTITEVGLYVDPKDGISISKTSESINVGSNKKLIYEYGKLEGSLPVEVKFSALLDGKAVIKRYIIDSSNVIINNESAKMWNWKYLRTLEDKSNKSSKETADLLKRSITNRILTTATAFLCLEPWMMIKDTTLSDDEGGNNNTSFVQEDMVEIGLEVTYGPNPITNFASIKLDLSNSDTKILNIGIYNIMGSVVKEFTFDIFAKILNLEWDTNSEGNGKLPSGVYYLIIKTNLGNKVLKLVVV
jgi:hypothetical protein